MTLAFSVDEVGKHPERSDVEYRRRYGNLPVDGLVLDLTARHVRLDARTVQFGQERQGDGRNQHRNDDLHELR